MTIENKRHIELSNVAFHDAMVRVPGGSRFQRDGKPIVPFGAKLAAEILGKSADEIRNIADFRKPDHDLRISDMHHLLLEGMDPIWLEEVASSIGIMCIQIPESEGDISLNEEVLRCGEGFGELCADIRDALSVNGDGGKAITAQESLMIHRQADKLVGALQKLLQAIEEAAE